MSDRKARLLASYMCKNKNKSKIPHESKTFLFKDSRFDGPEPIPKNMKTSTSLGSKAVMGKTRPDQPSTALDLYFEGRRTNVRTPYIV